MNPTYSKSVQLLFAAINEASKLSRFYRRNAVPVTGNPCFGAMMIPWQSRIFWVIICNTNLSPGLWFREWKNKNACQSLRTWEQWRLQPKTSSPHFVITVKPEIFPKRDFALYSRSTYPLSLRPIYWQLSSWCGDGGKS